MASKNLDACKDPQRYNQTFRRSRLCLESSREVRSRHKTTGRSGMVGSFILVTYYIFCFIGHQVSAAHLSEYGDDDLVALSGISNNPITSAISEIASIDLVRDSFEENVLGDGLVCATWKDALREVVPHFPAWQPEDTIEDLASDLTLRESLNERRMARGDCR